MDGAIVRPIRSPQNEVLVGQVPGESFFGLPGNSARSGGLPVSPIYRGR